jgi:hypothetical protein
LNARISDLVTGLRREMDFQFKVVLDKLEELGTRVTRLEQRR